ncbi:MAG: glycosyltransferase family 2 protein [Candidatus Gastranaerophilaceae bacterium]
MPKVSIIVPVYNVEKYLRQCLDSLVNQTLQDIEIICIDDKSTDNSLNILKEYAQNDNRIVVLEQEINQGQGVARNRALDVAKGDYIMFCDPDDWYELEACEHAYNQISTNKNDMVIFSFSKFYEETRKTVSENRLKVLSEYIGVQNIPLNNLNENYIRDLYSVCQIYDKNFLNKNNIRFGTSRMYEDQVFSVLCYVYANDISLLDEYLYNYRIRRTSTIFNNTESYKDLMLLSLYFFDLINNKNNKSLQAAFLHNRFNSIFYWFNFLTKIDPSIKKDFYNKIREYFIRINETVNIAEYKQAIGKENYKKFKKIIKYNYQQYVLYLIIRQTLKNIFSVSSKQNGDVCVKILGVKFRFKRYIFLNYRLMGNLLAWIFPTHESRRDFIKLCRNIEDIKLADKIQKYYPKLAKKLSKKKKLRVLFLVSENSKWKAQSLYDLMEKSEHFEPFIALTVLTGVHTGVDTTRNELEDNYKFFKSKGMKVVKAYENHEYLDLKIFKPDIVFYQQPWALSKLQMPDNVAKFALTCYIPYFVANYGILRLDTGLRLHKFLFRHYVLNKNWVREYQEYSGLNNYVAAGHTILDNFYLNQNVQPKNNYVIYAPHYSVPHKLNKNPVNYGTFLENGRFILQFAQNHPEINWVFKPHPQLRFALYNIWGEEKTEKYYKEWESFAKCCYNAEYIDLFLDSKALITDCASFLTEYFCTEKPILHLISAKCIIEPLRPFQNIIDTFYKVHNQNDLLAHLDEVIIKGNDYKKDERLSVLKQAKLLNNYAAANIMKDLEETIWGK